MSTTESERAWWRAWRKTDTGRSYVRRMNLRKYGITPEQYDAISTAQGGVCAACGQPETHRNQYGVCRLAVDHDHQSDVVRGLLCGRCNRALGLLADSTARVRALLRYREKFG